MIEAEGREDAFEKAEIIAREHVSSEDDLNVNGKPANRIFLGIKKILSVYNPSTFAINSGRPVHGTELSHSYLEVSSIEEAQDLAKGIPVKVFYVDDAEY